jgi:uncharacterized delta-60 repeat protein
VRRLGVAILLLACAAPPAAAAVRPGAPGWLDRSFGHAGIATLLDPYLSLSPSFMAEQPDGGILVGAGASVPGSSAGPGFLVTRFDRSGRRDLSFGDHGRIEAGLMAAGAAALPDGGFFVAGATGTDLAAELRVVRYTSRGTAAAGFGGGSKLVTALSYLPSPYDDSFAVAGDPQGRMLVALGGSVYRLTPEGALDPGFGAGGEATPSLSSVSIGISALAVQRDGRIVLAGRREGLTNNGAAQVLIARLMTDGSVDTSFGGPGAGRVVENNTTDWRQADALAVNGSGTIFASGYSSPLAGAGARMALWQVPSAGTNGHLTLIRPATGIEESRGLAIDRAGGIVLLGRGSLGAQQARVLLLRLRRDGSVDRGFGRRGRVTWVNRRSGAGPLLLRDGRILVAMGQQLGKPPEDLEPPNDVAVVRIARLWGGYDKVAPAIGVRLSCTGRRTVARLRVRDRSRISQLSVWIAGHRLWPVSHSRVRLVLRRPGQLRVVAVDQAGNRAERTVRVAGCALSG